MYDPGTRGMPQKYVLPSYTIHYTGRDWGEGGNLCMFALKKKKSADSCFTHERQIGIFFK